MRKSQSKEQQPFPALQRHLQLSVFPTLKKNSYKRKWKWRLCDSDAKLFLSLLNLPFLLLGRLYFLPQQRCLLLVRLCLLLERACSKRCRLPIPTLWRVLCLTHQVREKILYRCGPNSYWSSLLVMACRYLFFCTVIGCSAETERTTFVSFLCSWFLHLNRCVDFDEENQLKENHHHMTSLLFYPCDNNGIGCSIVKTRHTWSSLGMWLIPSEPALWLWSFRRCCSRSLIPFLLPRQRFIARLLALIAIWTSPKKNRASQ